MRVRRPLDDLLDQPSKVALLRELTLQDGAVSGSSLARQVGITPAAALASLRNLAQTGAVIQNRAGQALLYRLNREQSVIRRLVIPLFESEKQAEQDVFKALIRLLKKDCFSLILFGSAGTPRETSHSDIDLLCVANSQFSATKLHKRVESIIDEIRSNFQKTLSLHVLTLGDFLRDSQKPGYVRSIVLEGRVLHGKLITELIQHGRQKN